MIFVLHNVALLYSKRMPFFYTISRKRDMALPLAKLHSVRGFSWSLLRHLIIIRFCLLNFFFFAEQTEVSGAFERGDWGLFDVLWLHDFSLVWFYEVRGGKKNVGWSSLCFIYFPELLWWPSRLKFYGIKWKLFILPRLQHLTKANHPILHPGLSVNRSVIRYNPRNKF